MLTSAGFTLFVMHIVNFIFLYSSSIMEKEWKIKTCDNFLMFYIPNEWTSQELGTPLAPPWGPLLW